MPTRRRVLLVAVLAAALLAPFALATEREEGVPLDDRLAAGVAEWVDPGVGTGSFSTGHALFNEEWHFGTCQMAAFGFAQHAEAHPEARAADLARVERCIDMMLSEEGRAFDTRKWGADPLATLAEDRGHAAWLGYTNLVLSVHRSLDPHSRYAAVNDALTDALARRIAADETSLPETYPAERYPVDVAAGIASIGLHDRATGADHSALLDGWTTTLRARYLDAGLLVQSVWRDGAPADAPRGSGTFLAAYFLSFWDTALATELYRGGRAALYDTVGGLGVMREYPVGRDGKGDIDSGPIVAGYGVSATGFAIGAARAAGDLATAAALTRTATVMGTPVDIDGVRHWKSGAALGGAPLADAILFAMMTARVPPPAP
ncbi:MAG: hypothetical protein Q8P41_32030 [Pseudomonadota bacterium]|nr:hypothetical protein [Pseudomonadota bacterium]